MLAHMNHVQPKADLPSAQARKYSNAMPQRNRKSQVRNLTGLYLGVDGDKPMPQRHSTVPHKCRVRGMPSRRIQTPTEQKRYCLDYNDMNYDPVNTCIYEPYTSDYYPNTAINMPYFPAMPKPRYVLISAQKKVEMLRIKEDSRGFSGNPVKNHQGRGLMSSDEMARASMYPANSNQFWDVTKQTNRQFTATANSGIRHLEYLNADPNDAVGSFYPRAFDESLDDVLVQEIQAAAHLRKEVTGLIHCYNKICKGNSEALQSLLPNRPANPSRPNTYQKTGFSVKSYRTPAQADIESNFPAMEPRPKTVTGTCTDRPLVPSPYFFKIYVPPKTAGPRTSPRHPEHHNVVHTPGIGSLSRPVSMGQNRPASHGMTPAAQPRLKTLTMQAEDILPPSPRQPCGTPLLHTDNYQENKPSEKIEISLPDIQKTSLPTAEQRPELDISQETKPTTSDVSVIVVPPVVIGVEDASTCDNIEGSEKETATTEPLMKLEKKRQSRQEQLTSLLDEHAQIVQEISTQEKPDLVAENVESDKEHDGVSQETKEAVDDVKTEE